MVRAFWAHDFCDAQGTLTASFLGATAHGNFSVFSPSPGRDLALVGAGGRLEMSSGSTLTFGYDGELEGNAAAHAIMAAATVRW